MNINNDLSILIVDQIDSAQMSIEYLYTDWNTGKGIPTLVETIPTSDGHETNAKKF